MIGITDALIVATFLAVTLAIGLRQKSRSDDGANYLLGGRALTLPAFVATTVSTWYGGILGVGEYAWNHGISNWLVFGVPYYVGALLFAMLLSRRARSAESLTLPHMFERTYGPAAGRCAAVLIFLTTVPGAYMLIMGSLVSLSFGIPQAAGILLTAVFVVIYLWRGGFGAVVRTDGIQIVLMFGSFMILSAALLIGYGAAPLETLPPSHLEPTGGQPLGSILIWYVIALSTLAEPNFFQRAFAAKTPEIARKGLLISIAFWILFDMMTTLCGLYARALMPDLDMPLHAFPALAAKVLPAGAVGIFFAGLFATVLSTLDSYLFTTATTLGRDLWPHKSRLSATAKTRIGLIAGAALASAIALAAGSVVKIWKIFGSVSAASLLIPILTSYYPKFRMSPRGAVLLMAASSITTIAWFAHATRHSGAYWLGIEPLFAGAAVSICIYAADRIIHLSQRHPNASQSEMDRLDNAQSASMPPSEPHK
ncbi:MAG: sodium:solute symporter family protein [Proteobacteria bacterium]|nr:sodium:solute symporter family protein [Pseudomonadota bacterium]